MLKFDFNWKHPSHTLGVILNEIAIAPKFFDEAGLSEKTFIEKLEAAFNKGDVFEWTFVQENGGEFQARLSCNASSSNKNTLECQIEIIGNNASDTLVEATRRDDEQLFFDVLNAMPVSVHLWDEKENLIFTNNYLVNRLGFRNLEDFKLNYRKAYPEYQSDGRTSQEAFDDAFDKAYKYGGFKTEWTLINLMGEVVQLDCTLTRIKWKDGLAILEIARDMREQYRERMVQKAYQERMWLIIDNMPMGVHFRDENMNLIDCNQAMLNFFGFSDKQEYFDKYSKLYPKFQPDGELSADLSAQHMKTAFETGKFIVDWTYQKPDGTPLPAQVTLVRVEWQGKPMLCSFVRDLREEMSVLEEQKQAKAQITAMLNASPMLCYICDNKFNVIAINSGAFNIFNFVDEAEFIEKFHSRLPKKDFEIAFEKGNYVWEWQYHTDGSQPLPIECSATRMEVDGMESLVIYCRPMRAYYKYPEEQRQARARMNAMLNTSPIACFFLDKKLNIIDCNQTALKLAGMSSKEELYHMAMEFFPEYQPCGTNSIKKMASYLKILYVRGSVKFDWVYLTSAGEVPASVSLHKVYFEGENCYVAYIEDLRENMKHQTAAQFNFQQVQAMLDASPLACAITNEDLQTLLCSESAVSLFKLKSKDEFITRFDELSPEFQPDGRPSLSRAVEMMLEFFQKKHSVRFEWMHQTLDGSPLPCEVTFKPVTIEGKTYLLCYIQDLRDLRQALEAADTLERLAYTDSLTGARNRRYFDIMAEAELQKSITTNRPFSLIYLDVDDFKNINDTYGHMVGDGVLGIVVSRMRHALRKETLVARHGGEEFIVMISGANAQEAEKTACRIRESIKSNNFSLNGLEIEISVSIGVASREDEATLAELVHKADIAMYIAKFGGKDQIVVYVPGMEDSRKE